jgi:predicted metalloprotease
MGGGGLPIPGGMAGAGLGGLGIVGVIVVLLFSVLSGGGAGGGLGIPGLEPLPPSPGAQAGGGISNADDDDMRQFVGFVVDDIQDTWGAQQQDPANANQLSVRLELQADCLAGVWAHSAYRENLLEPGDVEEGLAAAAAVGDDRIQASTQGRIDPERWTHGSAEQRQAWFTRGFESGDPNSCNTFSSDL